MIDDMTHAYIYWEYIYLALYINGDTPYEIS